MDPTRSFRRRAAACLAAILLAAIGPAGGAGLNSAVGLQAKYSELHDRLGNNQFRKPLYLESGETPDSVMGDVYALIDQPFATAAAALNSPADWCEILILHINTKYCRAASDGGSLDVSIGAKYDQPLARAHQVKFVYQVASRSTDYLQVRLAAAEGPLSTRDYRIVLEAVSAGESRTFMHLSYSYGFGLVGRVAMQAYLGTTGRNKVGFTVVGKQSDGQPLYIGGMRGVAERNTMRYFLAIEAFLGALSSPPQVRPEKRLRDWFAASERYPRQLHEMEQAEYLEMKRKEILRQQARFLQESAHVQVAATGR